MSDVTAAEFYREMQVVRDHIDARHRSIRETMENRFDVLLTKLDDHAVEDRAVEARVHTIEIQRDEASKHQAKTDRDTAKKATYIGMLSAMLTSSVIAAVNYFRGGP